MANPAISRPQVHALAEACSDDPDGFNSVATRLVKEQRRLSRFIEQNMEPLGPMAGQVALYMLTVCMRVVEQAGGRTYKVAGKDLNVATTKVNAVAAELMPADEGFAERAKAVEWRAQPHLLDEILWALYERDDQPDEEVDLKHEQSAMIYLLLWSAVEALDANWKPAKGWTPEAWVPAEGAEDAAE